MRPARLLLPALLLALSLPSAAATVAEADALLKAKDPRATAAINGLVKSQPDDVQVRILQTRLLLRSAEAEDAIDAAEEAVDLAPDNAQAHYWLGNAYGYRIGQVGTFSQALIAPKLRDAFERAVQLDPNLHDARNSLVEYYMQAPSIVGGSPDKARAHVRELAKRDPPTGHYAAGKIAMFEKDKAAAVREFTAAYAARPENVDFRSMAGLAYQEARQWDQAFALYEAWTREDPKAAVAWYQTGRASALSGLRLEIGTAALKRYLALPQADGQPEPKHAWYRLGQVQAKAGDKASARVSFQRALKADPDYAEVRAELAKL